MISNKAKTLWAAGSGLAGFLILLFILIAVNGLLSPVRIRSDLTEDRLYTLSEGTRNVLAKLPKPVTLKLFFNKSDPRVPMGIKNFAARVEDLLSEYKQAAKGKIVLENYDPKPDSDAEDWARRYGVSGQSIGFMGPNIYLGLVGVMGDTEAVIPLLDPQTESLLEYNITRMITRVAQAAKPVIGVMSPLPVLGEMAPFMQSRGAPQAWIAFRELQQDYDVRRIPVDSREIPADLNTLILVHPQNLSDDTLYALDQFVLRGGRLMAFLDPLCAAEQAGADPMSQPSRGASDLPKLLQAWGIAYDPSKLVADPESATRVRGANNMAEDSLVWLSLRKKDMDGRDILTSQLESILLPYAGSFTVQATNGVEATPLLQSSSAAGTVETMLAQYNPDAIRTSYMSGGKALNLALRLHGKFKSAFPNGRPKAPDASATNQTETAEAGLTESKEAGTIILVADADLLYDPFCVRTLNFLGVAGFEPINDNIPFLVNAVEQSAGGPDLVSIRTRGKTDRPFSVVLDLLRSAQARYMSEELALQQKLEQTQQRLNELQTQKDQRQSFVPSPEQKMEIEKFRKQNYETRQALKLVRRNLQADIDRLGMKVKGLNILLVPGLVVLAGILFGLYRKTRASA